MLETLFKLKERHTNVRTELTAGTTTFLTAAYIIFVHPSVLAETGMDKGALTTVTCLIAGFSTLLLALWANVPLMMAPGMGLNAFFAFSLCVGQGLPWQTALGVVFLSGVFFLLLTWLGLRERIVQAIPTSLRLATSVGIGLFIAFIGMQNLGLVVKNDAVLVGMGEWTPEVILGLLGVLLIALLELKKIRGSLLLAIMATAAAGMALGLSDPPSALVTLPPSIAPIALKLDIMAAFHVGLWSSIFTFMFVDLFDSLGTMMAVCREAGMTDKRGQINELPTLLKADAIATVGGALLGTSTTTTYIESAAGVADGGRTGLASMMTACLFLVSSFFTPVIGSIPSYATAPALIAVGITMMRGTSSINFHNIDEGVPAFLTLSLMPLTYSIAQGLAFGLIAYVLIKILSGKRNECDPVLMIIAALSLISLAT